MSSWMFKLRGKLSSQQSLVLSIIGIFIFLLLWYALTAEFIAVDPQDYADPDNPEAIKNAPSHRAVVSPGILPKPSKVFTAFGDLYNDNKLIKNTFWSIGLNLAGYMKAVLIALPIGFIIGLLPLFRGAFQKHIDAIRFLPLTAVTGLFIVWFGIDTDMKVNFLAFGILIYLLPIIVQRIDEVDDVYLKTVYTLGANSWQTIKSVYIPSVISRLSDDIRILTAISWTYIIVAEMMGSEGGLGNLIFTAGRRQGRVDKVFALLVIIILIGVLQDKIFHYLDKRFFPHKHQKVNRYAKTKIEPPSILESVFDFAMMMLVWILLGIYVVLFFLEVTGQVKFIDYFFGETQWVIHMIFWSIIIYKIKCQWDKYQNKKIQLPQISQS